MRATTSHSVRRQLARRAASENRTTEILRRSREVNDLGEQIEIALRTRDAWLAPDWPDRAIAERIGSTRQGAVPISF